LVGGQPRGALGSVTDRQLHAELPGDELRVSGKSREVAVQVALDAVPAAGLGQPMGEGLRGTGHICEGRTHGDGVEVFFTVGSRG
jgi:hypothetical protein